MRATFVKLWLQFMQPLANVHETKWTPHVKRFIIAVALGLGHRPRAGINDGLSRIRWTKGPIRDFTFCSIRCVYRADLILGDS